MPRRAPYTKVEKIGQYRPHHVQRMGDVVFKGFQCLNSDCQAFLFFRLDQIGADFELLCPACRFPLKSGGETKLFKYKLVNKNTNRVIERGDFIVLHDDYVNEALEYKYCILCNALKPLESFDRHASRVSGRQGECRLCKTIYNGIKNQSRITDQHREAAQRRRLYRRMASEMGKIDSQAVFDKFSGECFNCGAALNFTASGKRDFALDHTLPARFLWPMTSGNATLLCRTCNGNKTDRWPSLFYDKPKLKKLARLTGYPYALLAGPPILNDDAIAEILKDPDGFIEEWIHYPDELKKVRRLILTNNNVDIFQHATNVPSYLLDGDEPHGTN